MEISNPITINHKGVSYNISKFAGRVFPFERHRVLFRLSNLLCWTAWSLYILCQFIFAISLQRSASGPLWWMWIMLWAETCLTWQEVVLAVGLLHALFNQPNASRIRPCYRLVGGSAPTVDVLVTCCGEPCDVVLDTVMAAAGQDYPSDQYRVLVLDDGDDERLREAVGTLYLEGLSMRKSSRPQVQYLSRRLNSGTKSYFKAGNLQFGIEHGKLSSNSEFVAPLDADMVPATDWLRRLIPHLLVDEDLALACPPQV